VIGFVARQLGVDGWELGSNQWSASTIEAPVRTVTRHRDSSERTFCGTDPTVHGGLGRIHPDADVRTTVASRRRHRGGASRRFDRDDAVSTFRTGCAGVTGVNR